MFHSALRTLIALIACTVLLSASGDRKRGVPGPNWEVKYKFGSSQMKAGQWLRTAFVTGEALQKVASPMIAISRDHLRTIYFNVKAEKRSDLLQNMPRSGCAYARSRMPNTPAIPLPETFVAVLASPGPISRAAEHLSSRHPVRLVWSDSGVEKDLVITVNACEYASFVANLRWFVGDRWQDVGRELNQR
jgi:hypothetical protein